MIFKTGNVQMVSKLLMPNFHIRLLVDTPIVSHPAVGFTFGIPSD